MKLSTQGSAAPFILLILLALTIAGSIFLLADPNSLEGSSLRITIIAILAATAVIVSLFVLWEFSAENKLRRALKKIAPSIDTEPADKVKQQYLQIYGLYLKLGEKKKQNFYSRVNSLRERIEDHLQNEKEISRLFQEVDRGSIQEQKKIYLQIYKVYEKLPRNIQHEYYSKIVQLRDRLERGK
ncbi:hypothetical protein HYV87_00050 [Candidatus Woesearchaeota archaeon]|nr:hypothetical protein [Candidatus Woesearchaeota archaeon]